MRLAELVLLCRSGAVVAAGVACGAGLLFHDGWTHSRAPLPHTDWPARPPAEFEQPWPPAVARLAHLWKPCVNGRIPESEAGAGPGPPELTARERFVRDTEFLGACWHASRPFETSVALERPDGEAVVAVGESVDLWRLLEVEYVSATGQFRLRFRSAESGDEVAIESAARARDWERAGAPFRRVEPAPSLALVPRRTLPHDAQAYYVASRREWWIPPGEFAWLRAWAEQDLLPTFEFEPHREAGVVVGLKILGDPGRGTPLIGPRGLRKGDVVTELNGAAQRSVQGLAASLRRFLAGGSAVLDVAIVRSGVPTTVRYRVPRR